MSRLGTASVFALVGLRSDGFFRFPAGGRKNNTIDPQVADQFKSGRLYAAVASRPGPAGRCDGFQPPPPPPHTHIHTARLPYTARLPLLIQQWVRVCGWRDGAWRGEGQPKARVKISDDTAGTD